jgi:DnaJ-class molecular chaperone
MRPGYERPKVMKEEVTCPFCGGRGRKVLISRTGLVTVPILQTCPRCNGTGKVRK